MLEYQHSPICLLFEDEFFTYLKAEFAPLYAWIDRSFPKAKPTILFVPIRYYF